MISHDRIDLRWWNMLSCWYGNGILNFVHHPWSTHPDWHKYSFSPQYPLQNSYLQHLWSLTSKRIVQPGHPNGCHSIDQGLYMGMSLNAFTSIHCPLMTALPQITECLALSIIVQWVLNSWITIGPHSIQGWEERFKSTVLSRQQQEVSCWEMRGWDKRERKVLKGFN